MEKRYHALRTIGTIYRVVGYIVLVLTVIAVLFICGVSVISGSAIESVSQQLGVNPSGSGLASGIVGGLIISIITILYGGIIGLSLISFGELIYLLIAVEENTRKATLMIEGQTRITPTQPQA